MGSEHVRIARQPDGSYLFEFGEPIEMQRTGKSHQDILANTQRCQDAIEAMVRKYPEQWLWFHRRWHERPRLQKEWDARILKSAERTKTEERSSKNGAS